jgi:hypothetical protein
VVLDAQVAEVQLAEPFKTAVLAHVRYPGISPGCPTQRGEVISTFAASARSVFAARWAVMIAPPYL